MTGEVVPSSSQPGRHDAYLPSPCVQNHAANLAFLPEGTLTCVWFGGTMEGMGDISVYMSRLEPGARRWSEPEKMSDDPAKSEQNPLIFTAPDGRVWLLFTSQTSGNQDGAVVKRRISTDGGKSFGPTEVLCDIPGTFVRQPIIVNAAGDWLLPVFRCIGEAGRRWTGAVDRAAVLVSRDQGKSWTMAEVPDSIGAVHMNIVPAEDGTLVAFYRNRFATNVLRSQSSDAGLNWTAPKAVELPNNNSSIQAIRMKNGAIAMVYNHSNASMSDARRHSLYDEIESDGGEDNGSTEAVASARPAVWGVPRAPLSLAFSTDGGRTFPRRIDLDTGDGYCLSNNSKDSLNREFSYPSIVEDAEGRLHVAYTYFRRAIKYVRLDPPYLENVE
ncbi:glycosyl hydrolase [Sinorhizobium fredii]|uniref:Glycosyl hydrolase n=5 Tax=Rhizobium fredii TaxID=380 RepID=A0A844AR23_RHIFR|nr:glycosyl hydrolase [Sinorhizobium fredii]MQX12580.1 glycosyl hydrolase [Sinorhizobium fredii]UTY47389.1 glycosyl hydrolase [Sinorhizobium fredii]